jgi:C-22 sterol desaturase
MAVNASFVSPTADAKVAHMITQLDNNSIISTIFNNLSVWRVLLTLIVVAVAYDQCMEHNIKCAGVC